MTSESKILTALEKSGDLSTAFRDLESFGGYEHLDHWQQGEFHHDHLLKVASTDSKECYVVIATNCNGAIKEILFFHELPKRWEIWGYRVPENTEFEKPTFEIISHIKTGIWFDPRRLLTDDTRSELLPEHRRRQRGGGWVAKDSVEE